jgi:toxin ParE1/3/4
MRLELSRRAQADLDDVRDYGVVEFDVARAAYLNAIEAAFGRVLEFPGIGVVHATLRPCTRPLGCRQYPHLLRGSQRKDRYSPNPA